MKKLMLGNEAIARGAYEAGVKVSAAYPGTPSTEISETIAKYDEVYAEWAPNEKVAAEVAIGASISGVRSMCCMKHVGLNVAADPLFTCSYTGVGGGLVAVVADDPGLYSSQNEQDTRLIGRAAMIPVIEPSDSQEAKDYMKRAFELSEKYDTPIILRTTTRLSHSQGIVELEERKAPEDKPYEKRIDKYVMMPGMAKKRHLYVEDRLNRMAADLSADPLNRIEYADKKIGFITSGIAYQYVKEAMPNASVLKLGLVNPLPDGIIREFAANVETVYVFEELEPAIEEHVRAMGIKVIGKEIFTRQGEYSANLLRKAVLGEEPSEAPMAGLPARPPVLCPGCPHRSVFSVMKKLKLHVIGDIGCYTLGAVAPISVIETTICMGSSISTLHGVEKAKGKDYIKNWVCVIGDSTFLHTGVNSLINSAYNMSSGTVVILDNSTTGMTGHQQHAATGKNLKGEPAPAIDLVTLCHAIGVKNVRVVSAFDRAALTDALKEETAREELSVIICKSPCVLLKGNVFETKIRVNGEKCIGCGACITCGCPALSKDENKKAKINPEMCNGCGLCASNCRFDAMEVMEVVK
ncbi:MAG: indolepyruvate ferredoxin oxidoreductase subunit alpha [Clostridia bacterium]|nr:indolepyruvate ferredoxin oxidoreductase subunit alpha [Clostridia bacterium]